MLDKMKDVLSKITRAAVVDERLVSEVTKDMQRILIQSDVNIQLVKEISDRIREKALREKLAPGISLKEHLVKIVYDELVGILGGERHRPRVGRHKALLVGLYGSGKTTTAAKLAKFYSKRGLKTCAITTDTWRPAAHDQLKQLCAQVGVPMLGSLEKTPIRILESAKGEMGKYELAIVDSAGRDSLDDELIGEIKRIRDWLKPDETYLVISADIGQTATRQATQFNDALGLTGVIVTKADSSGKAGGALSACSIAKIPVAFIGTGEKADDFEVFEAEKFISRLLGFPDIGALVKKVREAVEDSDLDPEDIMKGNYDLRTFYKQLEATKKMGPLKKVFEMMGMGQMPDNLVETSEGKFKAYKVIMDSMTAAELENPDTIKATRISRIAKGSGKKEEEVRELLKQFNMGKKMIKKFKGGKRGMQQMMRKFGNMPMK